MTNKKTKKNIGEYIVTIIMCSLIVFSIAIFIELELLFRCEDKVNFEELNMQNLVKFCTIEQVEKIHYKEPNNHVITIKLAKLYEEIYDYKNANELYLEALKVSERSNFALYSYAIFCAKRNLYTLASTLCEEITGTSSKSNLYKTEIYEKIAESFYTKKEYEASNKAYQVAYKYVKTLKDKQYLNKISQKYADSFIKLADKAIENKDIELATAYLENSKKIYYNPVIDYKLGLIYKDYNNAKSEKYMYKVFKENPYIINPYIYNSILNKLIKECEDKGEYNSLNFYTMRLNRFKQAIKNYYIFRTDIIIGNSEIYSKKIKHSKAKKYYISFDLTNNTKNSINNLYVKTDIFINGENYTLENKILYGINIIEPYDVKKDIEIELPKINNLDSLESKNNDIIVKYFAKKNKKAPWTLIKIDLINF